MKLLSYNDKIFIVFISALFILIPVRGQFVRTEGTAIIDEEGDSLLLRGVGLGGWMLQEGYMLRTWGAQYQIEDRIEELIGVDKKREFYNKWLSNHCTKTDIDSLAKWGFNSVRLPMHYKLFTPPIEEEPVQGQITWNEQGFLMVDQLVSWLKANDMYLILDLHAAPGGQGENADISDYDPSKPSLWESEENKLKMVALWEKIAERYADETTIAGYDLINETNWGFDNDHQTDINGCNQSNNAPLWDIQIRCTEAIRKHDRNHMIIIEGNCWGNNYNGLPEELWDDNLVISYHKYWNSNEQSSLDPLLYTRNTWQVPLWLGETGENSNQWFSDAIKLLEDHDIGWSWWPQKKMGGNNVQEIEINEGYQKVLNYWSGQGEKPTEEEASSVFDEIAENLKAENNTYHYDVVDAMTRQPYDNSAREFKPSFIAKDTISRLYFTDYDLGGQGVGYFDEDYTNETGQPGGAGWNLGGRYRNDGVDIENCEDAVSNGFNVGWTNQYEWMQYTVNIEEAGGYTVNTRYASISETEIKYMLNDVDISGAISLERTGGYQNWDTHTISDVVLEKGKNVLKVLINKGGVNLNYMDFDRVSSIDQVDFSIVSAITSFTGKEVLLNLNKVVDSTSISANGLKLTIDEVVIEDFEVSSLPGEQRIISIRHDKEILYESNILISYEGGGLRTEFGQELVDVDSIAVEIGLPKHYRVPGRIYADDFFAMDGMVVLKNENDPGSDYHLGYTNPGDQAEYYITVPEEGNYFIQVRAANNYQSDGLVEFEQVDFEGNVLNSVEVELPPTGGWETWSTSPVSRWDLRSGRSILRMKVKKAGVNLTWFLFSRNRQVLNTPVEHRSPQLYPNPSAGRFFITSGSTPVEKLNIYNLNGAVCFTRNFIANYYAGEFKIEILKSGVYVAEIITGEEIIRQKIVIK